MTYQEAYDLVGWLNERFRKARMKPWYLWAVSLSWAKLEKWAEFLGR